MANINQIKVNNATYSIAIPYCECSTAVGTATKAVTLANFSVEAGAQIKVYMTNGNSAASPKLKINNGTAYNIITSTSGGVSATAWAAGAVLSMTFNGTSWIIDSVGAFKDASPAFDGGGLSKGTASGGNLSGGGLSKGTGEVSITTVPKVTPKIDRSYTVSGATDSTYGVTTTQPTSGNYATFDPNATVTTTGKTKGRGSVSRAKVTRAAFSQKVTRGAVLYNGDVDGYIKIADNTQALAADSTGVTVSLAIDDGNTIAAASETSKWSSEADITPGIEAGTNVYIPVATATATAGTASASASIVKNPTATASATAGEATTTLGTDLYKTTATTGYTKYVTATGGDAIASAASGYSTASASATGGSASVGKGITAGSSASGTNDSDSATSTEKTASDSDTGSSTTYYILDGTVTNNTTLPSGQTSSGTINRNSYIKIGKGLYTADKYYLAQADAHNSYTPSSTYFQTSTTGAISGAKINKNQYATSDYYVKSGSAGTPSASKGTASNYSISVTPSVTNSTGWITGDTKSGTAVTVSPSDLGLTAKAAATYTPGATDQTISSGYYLTGAQTIKGDSDLQAGNIRSGVEIFGVTGTYGGGGGASGKYSADYAKAISGSETSKYSAEQTFSNSNIVYRQLDSSIAAGSTVRIKVTTARKTHPDLATDPSLTFYLCTNDSGANAIELGSFEYHEIALGDHYTTSKTVGNYTYTYLQIRHSTSENDYISGLQTLQVLAGVSGSDTGYLGIVSSNSATALQDLSAYQYVQVKQGSATNPTDTQTGATASLSGTTLTLSKSVTPSVTAGWVNSGTAATVKLSGTVPTETKIASGSGDITPNSGKLLSKVTVPAAGTTLTMTGAAVTDEVTIGTLSSGYYPVNAKVKGTVKPNAAGWVTTNGLGAAQATTATQVGKIVAGSFASTTSTATATALTANTKYKLAKGYYASDAYYTTPSGGITPSGNVQLTSQGSSSSPIDVTNYAGAYVKGGTMSVKAATPSVTGSWNSSTNKYVVTATAPAPVDSGTQTAGWVSSVTKSAGTNGTLDIAKAVFEVSGASIKTTSSGAGYIPASTTVGTVSSMTLPTGTSSSSSGTSKLSVTPGTSNKYINIPTGYNSSAAYYTVAGSSYLTAGNIKNGVTIFGVTGTYAPALEAKSVNQITIGTAISPTSGKDGMSSFTLGGSNLVINDNGPTAVDLTVKTGNNSISVSNPAETAIVTARITDVNQLSVGSGSWSIEDNFHTADISSSGKAFLKNVLFKMSNASTLHSQLTSSSTPVGFMAKYTGTTTTVSGVTYTNGNIYIKEA